MNRLLSEGVQPRAVRGPPAACFFPARKISEQVRP